MRCKAKSMMSCYTCTSWPAQGCIRLWLHIKVIILSILGMHNGASACPLFLLIYAHVLKCHSVTVKLKCSQLTLVKETSAPEQSPAPRSSSLCMPANTQPCASPEHIHTLQGCQLLYFDIALTL